jgi:hypothetical protein
MEFSPHVVLPLLLWGTLVGLDLVSVPQAMISRPVVAGTVAGALAGDVEAGLRVGILFELFALDVLPVGAVRYPDYGPATVSAAAPSRKTEEETAIVSNIGIRGLSASEAKSLLLEDGVPVAPAIAWHDERGAKEADALARDIGGERFTATTGLPPARLKSPRLSCHLRTRCVAR